MRVTQPNDDIVINSHTEFISVCSVFSSVDGINCQGTWYQRQQLERKIDASLDY